NDRTFADRLAAFDEETDTPAGRSFGQLAGDTIPSAKAAFFPAPLRQGESEARFEGAGFAIEIMTVKRQAGFEPQGIARAEPYGPHFRLRQQQVGQALGLRRGQRDLEPVFARITRAADPAA